MSTSTLLRNSGFSAAVAVFAMLMIFLLTGVGQDPLQAIHPTDVYAELLLRRPAVLRAVLGIDNLFVALYLTTFVTAGILLIQAGAQRSLVIISVALVGLTAFLDLFENLHFLTMLVSAEQGTAPTQSEISFQVMESLVKFHVSYVGLFLFGSALLSRSRSEWTLARLSWFVQLPVGILIYVTPPAIAFPLVFVRFAYFVSGLILLAVILGKDRPGQVGSSAPASFPSRTQGSAG